MVDDINFDGGLITHESTLSPAVATHHMDTRRLSGADANPEPQRDGIWNQAFDYM